MAINQTAWSTVEKYMPTHYIGLSGPCCDHCSRAYQIAMEAMKSVPMDDPEADGTDFAHPAWFRGNEAAVKQLCQLINGILDGKHNLGGISTQPWQMLSQRLYDIRTLLGIAERIVGQVEYDHNSKFYLNISQWYKVRQDYARRLKVESKREKQ